MQEQPIADIAQQQDTADAGIMCRLLIHDDHRPWSVEELIRDRDKRGWGHTGCHSQAPRARANPSDDGWPGVPDEGRAAPGSAPNVGQAATRRAAWIRARRAMALVRRSGE